MAKKRKHDSKTAEPEEPPKKQQQQQQEEVATKQKQNQEIAAREEHVVEEEYEEEVEEEEVEEEEEEEEVEEEEEEEEEEDDDDEQGEEEEDVKEKNRNSVNRNSSSGTAAKGKDDEDDEPIEKLLEPFGKDQLLNLLREAAEKHRDLADRIRRVADEDPVHRKIFVHGLGWDTNAETLMNAFKPYGEIEDCKAVCDKVSGKSKGYGFILFKKRSGARKALKQPQKKIGNRMTACQLASIGPVPTPGSTSGLASGAHSVSEYTQRKIYVSNVGAELDPQKLTAFFSKYGEIEEGPLGLDKFTGRPKGFCLFVYRTVEGAKRALEEPHKNFEGHVLNCQKAVDGPKSSKLQQQQHHHNVQRNDNNPAYSGVTTTAPPHLMAPAAAQGIGFTQGAAATVPALNPALGQALTALLATQGAGLGLTNLLGTLGSAPGMSQSGIAVPTTGMQGAYANQASISPGLMGVYGNQGALQVGYPNQQMGQGSSGRGQHAAGQYGGTAPYMGH